MKTKPAARVGFSLCLLLLLPACSPHGHAIALGAHGDADFCSSVNTRADAMAKRLDEAQQTLTTTWGRQGDTLQVYKTSQAEKVQDVRAHIDTDRVRNMSEMRARAQTGAEKEAVDTYAASMASAVQTRRQAVDTARDTFLRGVQIVTKNHQAAVSGEVQALKIETGDAYATAVDSCDNQVPPAAVHATLVQAIVVSRQEYAAQRKTDDSGAQIAHLAAERRASVTAANKTFQTAAAAARRALQAAWSSADAS